MKPLVSVLTGTIPGRERFLEECAASVASQTYLCYEHLVWRDNAREGCSATYNRLARMAEGEWLFILADDDLMFPRCLETHLAASAEADIVYAPPLVWGEPASQFCLTRPAPIPAVALIRAALWEQIGGYDEKLVEREDQGFYERADAARARFVRTADSPTWAYRFHEGSVGNKSRGRLA